MMNIVPSLGPSHPVIARLSRLSRLDAPALDALSLSVMRPRLVQPRRELLSEGEEIREQLLILDGWAARVRQLADGRRQIIHLLLPGDFVGLCSHDRPLAASTVVALTSVEVCVAPEPSCSPALARAVALSRAHEEAYLLAQITRLGRLNAYERIGDLLLELLERLEAAGRAAHGRFVLPLTQEVLADTLGLTSVHVDRTIQTMRRDGEIIWKGRSLVIANPAALGRQVGRAPVRVTAA